MSLVRIDPGLAVPTLPGPAPLLGDAHGGLALAARPGDGLLLLEGERGSVRVRERGPVEEVRLDGVRVATGLVVEAGVVANLVAAPAALRRERVAAGISFTEALVLPPRLPLLAVQVRRPGAPPGGGGTDPAPIRGVLTLLPDAASLRWRAEEGCLVAVDDGEPERTVVVALSPGPGALRVEPHEGPGIRVGFVLPAGEAPTLLLAAGRTAGASPLAPAPHLAGHERMALQPPVSGTSLGTGVEEMDAGVDWARTRLASAALRPGGAPRPWAAFWSGLGALAVGDEASATAFLERLEGWEADASQARSRGAAPDHPLTLPSGPLALLLAARHALTLGDAGPALRQAAHLDDGSPPPGDAATARLWSLALESLADGLRWTVGEDRAARYRRMGAAAAAGGDGGGARVRLPMAGPSGSPPGGSPSDTLAWLLGSAGARAGVVAPSLEAWAELRAGRAAEGYPLWRAALARGMEAGGAGRGSWDPWRETPEAPETGVLLATTVHGLLGWLPDAPVGRARLAPRFPEHLTRFVARGLRVGDTAVTLDYRREGAVRRFTLEPTAGRAPATLVFEPWVASAELGEARLDGAPVELDPREVAGGLVVPLQIPLDAPRTVELESRS